MLYIKRGTTLLLKLSIFIIVIPVPGFFIFALARSATGLSEVIPVSAYLRYPGLIALHGAVIPFLFALYQVAKLISYVHRKEAFPELSTKALRNIKYCGIIINALYVIGMPLLYLIGDADDAPGIILFGLIVLFASIMSADFAGVYGKRCNAYRIE